MSPKRKFKPGDPVWARYDRIGWVPAVVIGVKSGNPHDLVDLEFLGGSGGVHQRLSKLLKPRDRHKITRKRTPKT